MPKATIGGATITDGVVAGYTATGHSHVTSDVTGLDSALAAKQASSEKGQANGYASLDGTGKVPSAQLPAGGTGDLLSTNNLSDVANVATSRTNLGLGNVDNTSDVNKPVSAATQTALNAKANADLFARITGSNSTTTGQTLADIAGLSLALAANSVYQFEAVLMVQSSSTAGNGYGVQFSAAGATVEAQITGTLAAATQKTRRINALNTAATPFVTSGATGGIYIAGIITTGANAGNVTIQHLKVTSGTSTVFINSFMTAIKRA